MQRNAAKLASLATRRMRVKNFLSTARVSEGKSGLGWAISWVKVAIQQSLSFRLFDSSLFGFSRPLFRVFSAPFQHFGHISPAFFVFVVVRLVSLTMRKLYLKRV